MATGLNSSLRRFLCFRGRDPSIMGCQFPRGKYTSRFLMRKTKTRPSLSPRTRRYTTPSSAMTKTAQRYFSESEVQFRQHDELQSQAYFHRRWSFKGYDRIQSNAYALMIRNSAEFRPLGTSFGEILEALTGVRCSSSRPYYGMAQPGPRCLGICVSHRLMICCSSLLTESAFRDRGESQKLALPWIFAY